jgi:hypothetical protein
MTKKLPQEAINSWNNVTDILKSYLRQWTAVTQ